MTGLAITATAIGFADAAMRGDENPLAVKLLVAGLIVGLAVAVVRRIARMGTVLHPDHIELRGLWSTVLIRWCDVKRIGVAQASELDIVDGAPHEFAWLYNQLGQRFVLLCVNDKDLGRRRNLQDVVEAIRTIWRTGSRRSNDN